MALECTERSNVVETITRIEEFDGAADDWGTEAGFKIHTTEQIIKLAIDNDSSCCERWGYLLTEDDAQKFIGAELRAIAVTDTNRSKTTFDNDWRREYDGQEHVYIDDGDTLFVDIETDRGVLQFVAYNAHNGYYGHTARVESKQLKHAVTL